MSDLFAGDIVANARNVFELLKLCDLESKIEAINRARPRQRSNDATLEITSSITSASIPRSCKIIRAYAITWD